jgi:pilus assembly protein Flp/PilA
LEALRNFSLFVPTRKVAAAAQLISTKLEIFLRRVLLRMIGPATGTNLNRKSDLEPVLEPTSKDLRMRKMINRFWSDEEGAALIEYGMLVGLIAVVCVVAVQLLGTQINTVFTNLTTTLAAFLPA